MTLKDKQSGFSFIEALFVIVVIGGIALLGSYVMSKQNDTEPAEVIINTNKPADTEPAITNSDDLKELEENLSTDSLDDLDTADLDEAEAELL